MQQMHGMFNYGIIVTKLRSVGQGTLEFGSDLLNQLLGHCVHGIVIGRRFPVRSS